jgi:hypothetical protein
MSQLKDSCGDPVYLLLRKRVIVDSACALERKKGETCGKRQGKGKEQGKKASPARLAPWAIATEIWLKSTKRRKGYLKSRECPAERGS